MLPFLRRLTLTLVRSVPVAPEEELEDDLPQDIDLQEEEVSEYEQQEQEEEVTEELKRFRMQEMAGGFLYLRRCC